MYDVWPFEGSMSLWKLKSTVYTAVECSSGHSNTVSLEESKLVVLSSLILFSKSVHNHDFILMTLNIDSAK